MWNQIFKKFYNLWKYSFYRTLGLLIAYEKFHKRSK